MNYGAIWLDSWWPTADCRRDNSATVVYMSYYGCYWSASPNPSYSGSAYLVNFSSGYVTPVFDANRSFGMSVRCVQENRKKFLA